MKSVKRYDGKIEHCDNGGYVTFADYKKLEAQLENATGREMKLKALITEQQAVIDQRNGECDRLINELAAMQANIKTAESYPDDADLQFTIDWYDDERNDGLQVAMWLKELRRRREQPAPVDVLDEIISVASRLVDRYLANKNTDSEFICCVTPGRGSIGTGGVWDDWKSLDSLLRLNSGSKPQWFVVRGLADAYDDGNGTEWLLKDSVYSAIRAAGGEIAE